MVVFYYISVRSGSHAAIRFTISRLQGFLATSFEEKVAKQFIGRIPAGRPRVKWRVQVDPRGESVDAYRCQHVNFVKYGHCQGELE